MMPTSSQLIRISLLISILFSLISHSALGEEIPAWSADHILSRKQWKAAKPSGQMQAQRPLGIVVHHTGTRQNRTKSLERKMRDLQSFSQSRERLDNGRWKPAWPDVPYHFYISTDGRIAEGRDIRFAGDTNTDYNTQNLIQVALEGNFEVTRVADHQKEALYSLLAWLMTEYRLSGDRLFSHSELAQTACPGKNLQPLVEAFSLNGSHHD
jgi:hypothetical protein